MSGLLVLKHAGVWPAVPTRAQVLANLKVLFQGFMPTVSQFGTFPAFGPETSTLNDPDLRSYFAQAKAAGATAVEFAVSWQYQEPGYSYSIPGRDLSSPAGLLELKRRIAIAIREFGFNILLFCAGDGEGAGPSYNDAQGWTYGRTWLMNNFQRIYTALGPTAEIAKSVRPWVVFLPGYDATDASAGWDNPANCFAWWQLARTILMIGGEGYLGQEWSAGHCTQGDAPGVNTYAANTGGNVDVWLQEFPVGPLPSSNPDQVWQMLGRCVRPYNRPPQQPPWDDPSPPFLLAPGTVRGPWYYYGYEFDTYLWVRRQITAAQVEADRQYLRTLGCTYVC